MLWSSATLSCMLSFISAIYSENLGCGSWIHCQVTARLMEMPWCPWLVGRDSGIKRNDYGENIVITEHTCQCSVYWDSSAQEGNDAHLVWPRISVSPGQAIFVHIPQLCSLDSDSFPNYMVIPFTSLEYGLHVQRGFHTVYIYRKSIQRFYNHILFSSGNSFNALLTGALQSRYSRVGWPMSQATKKMTPSVWMNGTLYGSLGHSSSIHSEG